jgi:hypothetical protein
MFRYAVLIKFLSIIRYYHSPKVGDRSNIHYDVTIGITNVKNPTVVVNI